MRAPSPSPRQRVPAILQHCCPGFGLVLVLSILVLSILVQSALIAPALALGGDRPLEDPAAEARVQDIAASLRCLVCQNQTIAESDAGLARDLRDIIREQVAAGAADDQVRAHLVARYGDWILMRPPMRWRTALLWAAPALLLLVGIGAILLHRRRLRMTTVPPRPLDPSEEARLAELLERDR